MLVPARGTERWLSQRLRHRLGAGARGEDGVCAGRAFRSPRSLVAELHRHRPRRPVGARQPGLAAAGACSTSTSTSRGRAPWPATSAIAHRGRGRVPPRPALRRGPPGRAGCSRRTPSSDPAAGRLAARARRPTAPGARSTTTWTGSRRCGGALVERVDAPPPHERHAPGARGDCRGRRRSTSPPRLSLFGHTRLPVDRDRAARRRWAPTTTCTCGCRTPAARSGGARRPRAVRSRGARTPAHHRAGHPLLATLGRDVRELQRSLVASRPRSTRRFRRPRGDTLLGWLQHDLRGQRARHRDGPAAARRRPQRAGAQLPRPGAPGRRAPRGAARAARRRPDPRAARHPGDVPRHRDLRPADHRRVRPRGRGRRGGHPAHRLRVRLADRALPRPTRCSGWPPQLLELAGGRATASRVLDLVQTPPVRRRFGFTDDDLDAITAWVRESGVRWGFDQHHREPFGLDGFVQNTWRFGLDRVLAGVALSDDARTGSAPRFPLDDVASNRRRPGRPLRRVRRPARRRHRPDHRHPLAGRVARRPSSTGSRALTAVQRSDAWQSGQLQRELARAGRCRRQVARSRCGSADMRSLLGDHLAGRPTRANFRTGTLTVCTMVPMRSVPHRVVCLLGPR